MSQQMESRAAGHEPHSPEHPVTGASGARTGTHVSPLDAPTELDAPLALMAAAISTLQAPARVRNRCLIELRRQAAESWRRPRPARPGGSANRVLFRRLRLSAASAAGLMVVAAVCWGVFAASGVNPFARLWPAASGSPAAVSTQTAPPANDIVAAGDNAAASAGYISLPYSDPSIANGTEATLEVSMPVSQLMAWGVPAPGADPDDAIPVNLVLGADGLPMAVQVLPATTSTSSTTTEEIYP